MNTQSCQALLRCAWLIAAAIVAALGGVEQSKAEIITYKRVWDVGTFKDGGGNGCPYTFDGAYVKYLTTGIVKEPVQHRDGAFPNFTPTVTFGLPDDKLEAEWSSKPAVIAAPTKVRLQFDIDHLWFPVDLRCPTSKAKNITFTGGPLVGQVFAELAVPAPMTFVGKLPQATGRDGDPPEFGFAFKNDLSYDAYYSNVQLYKTSFDPSLDDLDPENFPQLEGVTWLGQEPDFPLVAGGGPHWVDLAQLNPAPNPETDWIIIREEIKWLDPVLSAYAGVEVWASTEAYEAFTLPEPSSVALLMVAALMWTGCRRRSPG